MQMLYPLIIDGGQLVGDALAMLEDPDQPRRESSVVLIRSAERLTVRWQVAQRAQLVAACRDAAQGDRVTTAMMQAPFRMGSDVEWPEATRVELGDDGPITRSAPGWRVLFARSRFVGLLRPVPTENSVANAAAPIPVTATAIPRTMAPTRSGATAAPRRATRGGGAAAAPRGATRGQRSRTPADTDAAPSARAEPLTSGSTAPGAGGVTDTLLAVARVDVPSAIAPSAGASGTLTIGLAPAPSPVAAGVMRFESDAVITQVVIDVMVEAPDFTCTVGWKHTLVVQKADPFAASITLELVPVAPEDRAARMTTVRVHYSYGGQPAGTVTRTIALGDVTAAEVAAIGPPGRSPALAIAPTSTPVDLTIRISRRDQSESARDLIWTMVDCAHTAVALPAAPCVQKVGDRDNASSFASKVTSQVNAADGTVMVDNMLVSIGTLIRRAMPAEVLQTMAAVQAAVGPSRLARVLLLTDECHVPWELAYLDTPPDPVRAPFLGAQYAISRWIHGEDDIPVPPPATLEVRDIAIVLGSYEESNLAPLPHAKDETTALLAKAADSPTGFPRVTSVAATADALVDLLNGMLPTASGTMAPEMVHFACHGEVLGTGVAKRSVLYLNDGSALQETLFVSSKLGRTAKSFLFMNACQVGVGGEELGQYAGFAGFAIAAGFSGFVGPLWSVNDEVAKRIAVDFYQRCFGTDGTASRPVADVLADMRSQYLSEADPKKRQSTWLAYVHYGHPHFTLTHA